MEMNASVMAQLVGLPPDHPLFTTVQSQYIAMANAAATNNPVLLNRTVNKPDGEMADDMARMAQEDVQEHVSDEVFAAHQYHEILPGCKAHPADIVEAGSLAVSLTCLRF